MSLAIRVALWLEARGSGWGDAVLVQAATTGDVAVNRRALERYVAGTAPSWVHEVVRRLFVVEYGDVVLWHPRDGLEGALDALRATFEPACLAWLAGDDAERQRVAALALGYYGAATARGAIVTLLDATAGTTKFVDHRDLPLLRAAVAAFLRIPPPDALAVVLGLRAKLQTSLFGREIYVALLERFGGMAAIRDEAPADWCAERRLLNHVTKHGPALLEELLADPEPGRVAFAARRLVPAMTDVARLRVLLAHPFEDVRMLAHRRLGVLGVFEVPALLDELARTTLFWTVSELCELLLRAGDPVAIEPLRRALAARHVREDPPREEPNGAFAESFAIFDTPQSRARATANRAKARARLEEILADLERLRSTKS